MIGAQWPALIAALNDESTPGPIERRLERALAAAGAVAWQWDVDTRESSLSAGDVALLSLKDDPADRFFELVHPSDRAWLRQAVTKAARGEVAYDFEFRLLRPDGGVEWVRDRGQLERDAEGSPLRLAGVAQLISAQKRTEAAYLATFEQAAVGMAHVGLNGAFLKVNDCACRILGRTRAELMSLAFQDITHPDDLDADLAHVHDLLAGTVPHYSMEKRYLRRDGDAVWAKLTVSLVRDPLDRPEYFISVIDDITERKGVEAEQRSSQARLLAIADVSSQTLWRAAPTGEGLIEDAGWTDLTGQTPEQKAGWGWLDAIHPDDRANSAAAWEQAIVSLMPFSIQHRVRMRNGVHRKMLVRAVPVTNDAGVVLEWVGSLVPADGERALAESEARLRSMLNAVPQMVWSTLPDGFHDFYNQRWYEFTGVPEGSTDGEAWNGMFHPDDQERAWARWRRSLASGEPYEIEYRLRHRSGIYAWVLGRALPVRDEEGRITRWMGTCTELQDLIEARDALALNQTDLERQIADRTAELRRANARLVSEMSRREKTQAALHQSQKLEALGQLTAGVAHDFNNAIAAIAGAFSIIERRTDDPRILDIARHGTKAAWRGNGLVNQMLMFARQQTLAPKSVDLCALLKDSEPLIRRSIGASVALDVEWAPDLPAVLVDPIQLESALINLAINARDAMPEGGTLSITARAVPADAPARPPELSGAEAVEICIVDTGTGIPPAVLQRVVEPFFTTKGVGKGTGLGLAMVHGFMQASGGALRITSQVGVGTTISLFLPQTADEVVAPAAVASPSEAADLRRHGNSTILLVDDDDIMRSITAAQLSDLGYRVVAAADATQALEIVGQPIPIDLILTDVVMPGVDGPELVALIRQAHPHVPVLFMTGHADRARLTNEIVIDKPFAPAALEDRLLDMLGRRSTEFTLDDEYLERLNSRIRSARLKPILKRWRQAWEAGRLPSFARFESRLSDVEQNLAVIAVDATRLPMAFHVERIAQPLADQASTSLAGSDLAVVGDETLGSREAAYRRCVRAMKPSYEYAMFDLGEDVSTLFERLLLPFSDDSSTVNKLASIVVIAGAVTAVKQ